MTTMMGSAYARAYGPRKRLILPVEGRGIRSFFKNKVWPYVRPYVNRGVDMAQAAFRAKIQPELLRRLPKELGPLAEDALDMANALIDKQQKKHLGGTVKRSARRAAVRAMLSRL